MRRLVLVFLMLLMTLQSTWSAAASVCTHEQAKVGQRHFGHHDVHHEDSAAASSAAAPDDAQSGDQSRANTMDNDHHHVLNVHPVPHIPLLASPAAMAQGQLSDPSDRYPSALTASLERPPRATADFLRQSA